MAMTEMNYGESGGATLTRHVVNTSGALSISDGKIEITNVTGKVVFAVVRYSNNTTNDIVVVSSIYDSDVEYSTSRTGDYATTTGSIEQTGTTAYIPAASSTGVSSPPPRVIYYTEG